MLCLQECPARHRLDSHQASVLGASTAVPRCLTTVCLSKRRVHAGSVSVPVAAEPIEIELMSTVATSAEMYRFCTVFANCSMHSQSRYSAVRNAITLTRRCQGKQPGSRTLHRQLDPTFRGSSWDSWPPESLELQAVIHEPHVQSTASRGTRAGCAQQEYVLLEDFNDALSGPLCTGWKQWLVATNMMACHPQQTASLTG